MVVCIPRYRDKGLPSFLSSFEMTGCRCFYKATLIFTRKTEQCLTLTQ